MRTIWRFVLCFYFITAALHGVAQQSEVDSIKTAISRYERTNGNRKPTLGDSVLVNLYDKLASGYLGHDLKKSLSNANKQLSIARKINFKQGLASAYNNIGNVFQSKADWAQAIKYYSESLKISRQIGDKSAEASANGNIGSIYGNQANFNEALKYMLRSLALSKSLNDKFRIAGAYNNIGVLYMQQKNPELALKNYLNCLQFMEELGNNTGMGVICNNIGQIYAMRNEPDLALQYLRKGLAAATKANDVASMANNYNGLGHVYTETKAYPDALKCYLQSLALSEKYGDNEGIPYSYLTIGRTYFLMGESARALEYAEKAKASKLAQISIELMQNYYELVSKIYAAKKDYANAYRNQLQYNRFSDSLYNKENAENFSRLKLKYDLESAQDSIAVIQTKKDVLAQAEIKSALETRNFTYIILGLIVVFLVILLWQRNKIALVKRQKALEQERNRISRDLHDNLGSQLSTVRMFVSSLKNGTDNHLISEKVDNSIGLLDASIGELRGIMNDMNNSLLLEQGYLAATELLINKVNQLHGVQFSLTHHKMDERLDVEIEHQLYRITQELINNTLKYASAKIVSLDLIRRDGKLVMMYEDDGIGYDASTVKKGYGLQNIESRVKLIHGTVEFDAVPNNGARTNIEIPLA